MFPKRFQVSCVALQRSPGIRAGPSQTRFSTFVLIESHAKKLNQQATQISFWIENRGKNPTRNQSKSQVQTVVIQTPSRNQLPPNLHKPQVGMSQGWLLRFCVEMPNTSQTKSKAKNSQAKRQTKLEPKTEHQHAFKTPHLN